MKNILARSLKQTSLITGLMYCSALTAFAAPNPSLISKNYFGPDGKEIAENLVLTDLDVEIDVRGGFAENRVLAEFQNPTDAILEGEFEFDMPEGSTLIGYGLDIQGEIREGVIVEKKKAERAFNDRIRRGVDPGLAETTRENAFTTRVFPIQPGQARQVSVTYITPLSDTSPYTLPLESSLEPERVKFTITGDISPGQVKLPGKFTPGWNEAGDTAHLLAENLPLDGLIEITPDEIPLVSVTRHAEGRSFAAFTLDAADSKESFAPNSIRVFWDTSLSQEAFAKPAQSYLSDMIDDVHPYSVQLVPFSDGLTTNKTIDLRPEGEELEHFTDELNYHGATNLEAAFAAAKDAPMADACFIVTDGRFTLGDFPNTKLPCKQVHTVTASPEADTGVLSLIAKQGGGQFINLSTLTAEQARKRLDIEIRAPSRMLIDGRDVLGQAEWLEDGDRFRLILPVDPSARNYLLTVDGETMQGALPMRNVSRHSGAGSNWAKLRLISERAKGASREALIKLSQKYSVVGDETSLLVLETLWDYIENEIALPDDGFTKQQRAEYAEGIANKAAQKEALVEGRIEKMTDLWKIQKAWYDGELKPEKRPSLTSGGREVEADMMVMEEAPSMGAAPPPPPAAEPTERRQRSVVVTSQNTEQMDDTIIVTGSRITRGTTQPPTLDVLDSQTIKSLESAPELEASSTPDDGRIDVNAWTPERRYLDAVEGLCGDPLFTAYLDQRDEQGSLPSYFLEMADVFAACGDRQTASRVALSALELSTANDDTLTAVAMRLMRYGEPGKAIPLLRKVVRNDPTRPQPWRDLALALDRYADATGISREERRTRLEEALQLLNHVIATPWDDKYDGIEIVSIMEANRVASRLKAAGGKASLPSDKLTNKMPVDLRIVVGWNVDETDMDLWVDEPTGERAMYSNALTQIGGRLSNDMTQGYGPEEYLLKDAMPGTYEIYMDYYGSDIVNPNGAVAIQAEIWRNWGSEDESYRIVDLEFTDEGEDEYLIATVVVE